MSKLSHIDYIDEMYFNDEISKEEWEKLRKDSTVEAHDDLFLTLHHMDTRARVLMCSLPASVLASQDVVYRRLSSAGFHKEAHTILMMDSVDYNLLLLNLPEPPTN